MPTNHSRYNVEELLRELRGYAPSPITSVKFTGRGTSNERKTYMEYSIKRVTVEYTDIVNYTFPYLKKTKELQKLKKSTIAKVVKLLEAKTIKDKEEYESYTNSRTKKSGEGYGSYFTDDFIT